MFVVGGAAMYMAVESLWKGFLLVVGSILLDLGLDEAVLMYEKRKGDL